MCPFLYMEKCLLRRVKGSLVLFDVYCVQDKHWKTKFSRLKSCGFHDVSDTKSCWLRTIYNQQHIVQEQVSRLENRGF